MKYRAGYKYVLAEDLLLQTAICPDVLIDTEYIKLTPDGQFWIKHGYAWDGATAAIDTLTFMTPSLEHDAFAQLMREGLLDVKLWFSLVNLQLYHRCLEKGMSKVRAWWVWFSVENSGGKWAKPGSDGGRPIVEAP